MIQTMTLGQVPGIIYEAWKSQAGHFDHIRNVYMFMRYWFIFVDSPGPGGYNGYVSIVSPRGRHCGRLQ